MNFFLVLFGFCAFSLGGFLGQTAFFWLARRQGWRLYTGLECCNCQKKVRTPPFRDVFVFGPTWDGRSFCSFHCVRAVVLREEREKTELCAKADKSFAKAQELRAAARKHLDEAAQRDLEAQDLLRKAEALYRKMSSQQGVAALADNKGCEDGSTKH